MDNFMNFFWPLDAAALLGSRAVRLRKRISTSLVASKRSASHKPPTPSVLAIRLLEGAQGDDVTTRFVCFGVCRREQVKTAALLLTKVDLPQRLSARATRALCVLMMSGQHDSEANCVAAIKDALVELNRPDVIASELIMAQRGTHPRQQRHFKPDQLLPVLKSFYSDSAYHNWQHLTQHLLPK